MASSALEELVRCAQAIEDRDLKLADSLLERIWNLASEESDERQRNLVAFFAEALVRRAYGLHSAGTCFTLELKNPFYNWQLNNVINHAVMGKKRLHLIDFYIPHVHGWAYLFRELRFFDSVRVSVIIPSFLKTKLNIQKEKEYLSEQAKRLNIMLEENLKVVYANSLGEVDDSMLDFSKTEDEGVVVYYSFKLHKLLAEVGAMGKELLKLRHVNPDIVIIEEQDANLTNSNFIRRLKDSFQYYSDVFRYPLYKTENYYRRQIHNILGCEGRDRIVRQQTLAQWRSCFLRGGFLPIPLESKNIYDEIHEDNGSWVITKQNRPMYFISAWKLKDGEDHLNPSSNYLEEKGLNPSLQLEDRIQPLPYFREGLSLNHLAAASEIYEMLEELSFTYELPLALTWACGIHLDEIRYKNTLSIQNTFCHVRQLYHANFIKICGQDQLLELEVHAIARKALQSSEHFHFEPSISKLKKADHPLGEKWYPDRAVMAICLQKYYNIDDVYVVEFFLPPETKSLALQIFNDLKNMKKKFVTVRGVLQGLNEQVPNFHPPLPMHASSPPGPQKQGIGKQIPFEPLAINEYEMVKADVNNLPISSAKRRKSDVWEEFDIKYVGGKKCAICKHCERESDGSSIKGTTHLRNHVKTCKSRAEKDRDQQVIFPAGRGDSKNGSASEGISSFDQDRSSMDVARMIIKNHFRLNIVEDEFFNILLKNLQPMFKLQSQKALSSYIFRVYEEEKHKLRGYFDKLSCRFNLKISLWAHDVEKITYCCYGVQFIDDDWELKKKILVLKSLGNQFDKRIFYENFKDFCVDWNFNKKICSVTIHNSSSCSEIAEEIRKSWHSFEASHPLSTFYLGSDECIRGLLSKDNSGENVENSIHSVTRTSNACLLSIHEIYKKLNQQKGRGYPLMNVKSDNNWSTCSLVLAIAAVLDPRFNFAFVEFSYNTIYGHDAAKIHLTMIRNAFIGIFNEYGSNMYSDTNSSTLLNAEENTMESFHMWINSQRNVNTEASWKSELDKYVHQSIIDFTPEFDLLSWWCEQASSFPVLGRMVRDILAIPMSSILSDSTFNEKVVMDTPIFSGLDPQIIEAMICGRDWLEFPKEISNVEPNKRSRNIGCPIVKLDSPALAHHSDIERFSSESEHEAFGNQDLGRGATWTEKDVRAYLLSPFTVEELEHFSKWKDHALSGESVGRDKIQGNALAPLLKIPPRDVDLEDAQNYYIEDTVVNQFFILLKRRYKRFPHEYPKHHSFDSSTATFLIKGTKAEYQVLSWVNQEDLKGVNKLFLPICLNEHWLLFYADIDDKKLLWLDSNEHSRMSNVSEKQVIQQWFLKFLLPSMEHDPKDWLFDVPKDIPLQKNSVDCALFVMKYADCLTHGNYFPFTQDDMPHFRYRTFLDLCLGSICLGRSQDNTVNQAPVQNMVGANDKG